MLNNRWRHHVQQRHKKKQLERVDKEIKVAIQGKGCNDLLVIDLGKKNKLSSVNYSGGDTGGGNATVAYSFSTYNTFILTASGTFVEQKWIDQSDDAGFDD